ncbi:MAG: hypothetical protein AAGI71_15245 [Bacteroidota bacterium]
MPDGGPAWRVWAGLGCLLLVGCGAELQTATRTYDRAVDLGARALVLNTPGGTVDLVGGPTTQVSLAMRLEARGRNQRDAQRVLAATTLDEAQDSALYQFVVTAPRDELIQAEVSGTIPRSAPLFMQVQEGAVTLHEVAGSVTLEQARTVALSVAAEGPSSTIQMAVTEVATVHLDPPAPGETPWRLERCDAEPGTLTALLVRAGRQLEVYLEGPPQSRLGVQGAPGPPCGAVIASAGS